MKPLVFECENEYNIIGVLYLHTTSRGGYVMIRGYRHTRLENSGSLNALNLMCG